MISVRNLTKIYKLKGKNGVNNVTALNDVSLDFPDTGLVFLLGKSGSGKSTLLNTIGGLDSFDSGEIIIKGKSSKDFKQSDFDSYRNTFIGFIFQEYNVLEEFTVGKNLSLALELQGKTSTKEEVNKLLEQVDLEGYYKRKPNQLSGGQKQRVAIARALIKNPEIIMADEPTGALDSATGKQVMDTLKNLSKEKLVIIVSHDREFAEIYGDRVIELKDGKIIKDDTKTEVEPTKSESGVSFIDDKIIHIKKGQPINENDLKKINEMIMKNIDNEDTIISFDQKSNTDVKKSAFITEEGNREVFKTTTNEDIKRVNHNPKDFKMIKSKLKFKDSFKMGASSLKHKPIRLIFTILLSVFAFGMFGVVNTMSSFNRADSVYSTLKQLDVKTIAINKNIDYYDSYSFSDAEFAKFQADNSNHTLYPVIGSRNSFYTYISSESANYDPYAYNTLRREYISGIMAINEDITNYLNLQLVEGVLPSQNNEICISYNIMETIKTQYNSISSVNDLQEKGFSIGSYGSFKIVGVIKDATDISRYENLKGDNASWNDNYELHQELDILMECGLINMCYVTSNAFETLKTQNTESQDFQIYDKNQDYVNGGYYYNFSTHQNYHAGASLSWAKDNKSLDELVSSLTSNQAIISRTMLTDRLGISYDELNTKLDEGLSVDFCYGYEGEKAHAFTLEIVGCWDVDEIVISQDLYSHHISGCDYIVTKFSGSNADKTLVKYFENNPSKIFNFNIQFQSTSILDNFGGMIKSMANVLLYVGIGLAVFAGLMLMNFISTSISYKKREIGVLRAIGARSKDVFSIFFSESFIICMINFLLSAIGSGIICNIINSSFASKMGVSLVLMVFGFKQIMLLLGIAMLVAFVASFFPVYRFAKKNPIDSINNR